MNFAFSTQKGARNYANNEFTHYLHKRGGTL